MQSVCSCFCSYETEPNNAFIMYEQSAQEEGRVDDIIVYIYIYI